MRQLCNYTKMLKRNPGLFLYIILFPLNLAYISRSLALWDYPFFAIIGKTVVSIRHNGMSCSKWGESTTNIRESLRNSFNESLLCSSTPFDKTTAIGHLCYFLQIQIGGCLVVLYQTQILSFFCGFCLYLRACCLNIKIIFDEMDLLSSSGHSRANRLKTKELFKEIINLHVKTQEIFADVADIMSSTIFLQLIIGVLFVSSVFFQTDSVSVHSEKTKKKLIMPVQPLPYWNK